MFQETQKFRQWWLWLILFIVAIGILWPVLVPLFTGKPAGIKEVPTGIAFLIWIIPFVGILLMYLFTLQTEVTEEGVSFRFFPLIKKKLIPWSQIENAYVRKYNPLLEFGGWGIRYSMGKNGRALNVSGNMGLQLVMKDGRKILIGTQRPDELKELLKSFAKRKLVKNVEE